MRLVGKGTLPKAGRCNTKQRCSTPALTSERQAGLGVTSAGPESDGKASWQARPSAAGGSTRLSDAASRKGHPKIGSRVRSRSVHARRASASAASASSAAESGAVAGRSSRSRDPRRSLQESSSGGLAAMRRGWGSPAVAAAADLSSAIQQSQCSSASLDRMPWSSSPDTWRRPSAVPVVLVFGRVVGRNSRARRTWRPENRRPFMRAKPRRKPKESQRKRGVVCGAHLRPGAARSASRRRRAGCGRRGPPSPATASSWPRHRRGGTPR
jgi:hypothetical protein